MPRILIVSDSASVKFGGEAILPFHYFRVLRQRNYPVWLLVHSRTRDELSTLFNNDPNIFYVEDTAFHRSLYKLGTWLFPEKVAHYTIGFVSRLITQFAQRRLARILIAEERIDIVHQPMPVSPREPSMMYGLGVPVVIGPMNGAMTYPPAFRKRESWLVRSTIAVGRQLSDTMNFLIPGKLRSSLLLVANERTRKGLPGRIRGKVAELVENGVDMQVWSIDEVSDPPSHNELLVLVFIGRLIDFKSVDLLLEAFRNSVNDSPMTLTIVGDGPMRSTLEEMAQHWGILANAEGVAGKVFFSGWLSQAECSQTLRRSDSLVFPSLFDCGGAVVLEAMAAGRAVIASYWGGPADYVDDECGILVHPSSQSDFISGLSDAMILLAKSPGLARTLGKRGRQKVAKHFDWEVKVDHMLNHYDSVLTAKTL